MRLTGRLPYFDYDLDGNRSEKGRPGEESTYYGWDTQNRLIWVEDPVAGRFTFAVSWLPWYSDQVE